MANVFKKYQNYVKKPNRNAFDLSFTNNFTTNFGKLTPVFCKEVLPGDSIRIDPTFGLNFAPMTYPVQTRMKAHLHFFYVRNRSLWKDWIDFIGNTKKNLVPPYINFSANKHLLKSGSLADYLGLPTTLVKPTGYSPVTGLFLQPSRPNERVTSKVPSLDDIFPNLTLGDNLNTLVLSDPTPEQQQNNYFVAMTQGVFTQTQSNLKPENFSVNSQISLNLAIPANTTYYFKLSSIVAYISTDVQNQFVVHKAYDPVKLVGDNNLTSPVIKISNNTGAQVIREVAIDLTGYDYGQSFASFFEEILYSDTPKQIKLVFLYRLYKDSLFQEVADVEGRFNMYTISYTSGTDEFVEAQDLQLQPYGADVLPISALPFRAYEAIYNSFYRNPQNNPFIKDGVPEYNTFVTNLEGGLDSTNYDLFNRNWDDDYLTTAVQSPQQGVAPLVGVSASGEFTFQDDNGTYKAQATFGEDGETITGINITDNRMPAGTTRALVDMVSTGISINDFRNVNALQRWLEKNMRRGLRYKDQMMSHFGANVEYDELLMPEFIGGVSNEVDVNRIINTADVGVSPLGAYGGLAQSFGGTPNKISHYADEHGFIIGILSVVPYANYSQLLPKMFTRNSVLDYYFPEFGAIGMQAITNRDIMPLQAYASLITPALVNAKLSETFGYQRPWWDYISSTDEVHGRFRTDFRDYLLNRIFAKEPSLNPDFLTINAKDLNDVFSVIGENPDDADNDKILGIIHFKFTKKTTIPEYGIPQLEVQ